MPKKKTSRRQPLKFTPEELNQLDRETLVSLLLKVYEQNVQLSEQMQAFLNERYGRKTERHEDPNQLRILESPQQESATDSSESTSSEETKPKKPGHGRNPMPSHLDRKQIRREPTELETKCQCGGCRVKINEVTRGQRYECVPATFFVEEFMDAVFRCTSCGDTIVVDAQPLEPIANGSAGPQLLYQIAEDRFIKHLPYFRQEQAFARKGVDINRSTMCGWMASIAEKYRPVYERMKAELIDSTIIATDDTPVKVQDRTKKNNIKRGHEWIFMGDAEHPVNLFHYTQGRSRAGPKQFIPGFKGFLQGDCFSGNRALCAETGATFVACRAHDRRGYKKARPNNKQRCDEMLDMYAELFEIERTARELNLSNEDIVRMRQEEAKPILLKMKAWLDAQVMTALPASSFGKAVGYSLNNWESLNNYLLHGELRIDNNLAEQQMKMFATGRKNWYFFGSDEAGDHNSIMLSLFSTCLRNGVEPSAYFLDTMERLTKHPDCDIEQLLPHKWQKGEIDGCHSTPQLSAAV